MEDKRKRGGRAAKDQASIAPALHEQHHLLTLHTAPSTVTPWGVCRVCVCVCVCVGCVCVCVCRGALKGDKGLLPSRVRGVQTINSKHKKMGLFLTANLQRQES